MENYITPQNKWEREALERYKQKPKKRDWWIRVPKKWWFNDLAELGMSERCVLIDLKLHANKQKEAWPSTRTMAKQLKVSQPTILKAIKSLEKKGFIKITKKAGRFNSYKLNGEA